MLGLFKGLKLRRPPVTGIDNGARSLPALPPPDTGRHQLAEPTATDCSRLQSADQALAATGPVSTVRCEPPEFHAAALLAYLQGPGGRTGTIPFPELHAIYVEMCAEMSIEPAGWVTVGREFRALLGAAKSYNGAKRIYRIPPAQKGTPLRLAKS